MKNKILFLLITLIFLQSCNSECIDASDFGDYELGAFRLYANNTSIPANNQGANKNQTTTSPPFSDNAASGKSATLKKTCKKHDDIRRYWVLLPKINYNSNYRYQFTFSGGIRYNSPNIDLDKTLNPLLTSNFNICEAADACESGYGKCITSSGNNKNLDKLICKDSDKKIKSDYYIQQDNTIKSYVCNVTINSNQKSQQINILRLKIVRLRP